MSKLYIDIPKKKNILFSFFNVVNYEKKPICYIWTWLECSPVYSNFVILFLITIQLQVAGMDAKIFTLQLLI